MSTEPLGKKNEGDKKEEGERHKCLRYNTEASKPEQTPNHRAENGAGSRDAEIDTAVVALNHASKFDAERGESQRGEGERIGHLDKKSEMNNLQDCAVWR